MTSRITAILLTCLSLAACAGERAGTATSNSTVGAPSGITASNGGGMRQLGNTPSIGITNGQTTISNAPNSKGNSY